MVGHSVYMDSSVNIIIILVYRIVIKIKIGPKLFYSIGIQLISKEEYKYFR